MSDTARPVTGPLARRRVAAQAMGWTHRERGANFATGFAFRAWLLARWESGAPFDPAEDIAPLWDEWEAQK